MGVIYTIAHPVTNNIVYVGASKNLSKRIAIHTTTRSTSPISIYIQSLKKQYLLPKIECIDHCDSDELMYFEKYWIQQLQSWGFDLLNKNGKIGIIVRSLPISKLREVKRVKVESAQIGYVKLTAAQWVEKRRLRAENKSVVQKDRKSKKWSLNDFELGTKHVFTNRSVYVVVFRQIAKSHGIDNVWLKIEKSQVGFIGTVVNEKPIYSGKLRHKTKSGKWSYTPLKNIPKVIRRAREKKFKYGFDALYVGDSITINFNKWDSFKMSVSDWNKRHTELFYKWDFNSDNTNLIVTFVETINEKSGPNIPQSLARPNRGNGTKGKTGPNSKLNEIQKNEIKASGLPIRELAIMYDMAESSIYNLRKNIKTS